MLNEGVEILRDLPMIHWADRNTGLREADQFPGIAGCDRADERVDMAKEIMRNLPTIHWAGRRCV